MLDMIAVRIADCKRCPLHAARKNTVPGEGLHTAAVVFIGEGPGSAEDSTGRPFVGPAGKLLNDLLAQAKIPREKLWLTNLVKCRPHTEERERAPTRAEIGACRMFLDNQLAALQPRIVVLLGALVTQAVLDTKAPVKQMRQKILRRNNRWTLVTYHPAAEIRRPSGMFAKAIVQDLALLRDLASVEWGTAHHPWSQAALKALFGNNPPTTPRIDTSTILLSDDDPEGAGQRRQTRIIWRTAGIQEPFKTRDAAVAILERFARQTVHPNARVSGLRGHDARGFAIAPFFGPSVSVAVD
jgi:DNA polymerase